MTKRALTILILLLCFLSHRNSLTVGIHYIGLQRALRYSRFNGFWPGQTHTCVTRNRTFNPNTGTRYAFGNSRQIRDGNRRRVNTSGGRNRNERGANRGHRIVGKTREQPDFWLVDTAGKRRFRFRAKDFGVFFGHRLNRPTVDQTSMSVGRTTPVKQGKLSFDQILLR